MTIFEDDDVVGALQDRAAMRDDQTGALFADEETFPQRALWL